MLIDLTVQLVKVLFFSVDGMDLTDVFDRFLNAV